MCVLYVLVLSFESKVRHRTLGSVVMGSAVFILRSAWSEVNRVQVVLFMRLVCFVQAKTMVWLYVFICCTRACVYRSNGDVSA